jgi:hypothetical protein
MMDGLESLGACPKCGKRMVEVGDDKRYLECLCGYRFDTFLSKEVVATGSTKSEVEEEISASEYADGKQYAEQIFRPEVGEPEFLVWDSSTQEIEFVFELRAGKKTVHPLKYSENEARSVWLSDGAEEYSSLRALRDKTRAWALKEYDPMGNVEEFELFLSHGLLSWVPEIRKASVETFFPIFRVMGPSESGKKRYLTVGRHIYRRPFYALKSNRVPSIFRGVGKWPGSTLVLDEADSRGDYDSDLMQFLNSRADGIPIPRFDADHKVEEFIHSEGYSIIATRFPFKDTWVETRCVTQKAVPTDRPDKYDLIPPPEWVEEGRAIMRQLMMFRLRNRNNSFIVPSNLIIADVGPRVRLTHSLLHALKDQDPTIVKDYEDIGKRMEAKLREARSLSDEGYVLGLVYGAIDHESGKIPNLEYDGSVPFLAVPRRSEDQELEGLRQPLTAGYVAEQLRTFSARDVSTIWRGLGETVKQKSRYSQMMTGHDGKERTLSTVHRGILQITDSRRLAQEFKRFVPNCSVALVALAAELCMRQATPS